MADGIQISFSDDVTPALAEAPQRIQQAVQAVVQQTADKAFSRIQNRTPRDSGEAASGWRKRQEVPGEGSARTVIENDVAHINVLEYGSYPVIPASRKRTKGGGILRGNAYVGGNYKPGPRTIPAPGGTPEMLRPGNVSRQAPRGMVRVTLQEIQPEYVFDLEEAIDRALNTEDPV